MCRWLAALWRLLLLLVVWFPFWFPSKRSVTSVHRQSVIHLSISIVPLLSGVFPIPSLKSEVTVNSVFFLLALTWRRVSERRKFTRSTVHYSLATFCLHIFLLWLPVARLLWLATEFVWRAWSLWLGFFRRQDRASEHRRTEPNRTWTEQDCNAIGLRCNTI